MEFDGEFIKEGIKEIYNLKEFNESKELVGLYGIPSVLYQDSKLMRGAILFNNEHFEFIQKERGNPLNDMIHIADKRGLEMFFQLERIEKDLAQVYGGVLSNRYYLLEKGKNDAFATTELGIVKRTTGLVTYRQNY